MVVVVVVQATAAPRSIGPQVKMLVRDYETKAVFLFLAQESSTAHAAGCVGPVHSGQYSQTWPADGPIEFEPHTPPVHHPDWVSAFTARKTYRAETPY